MTETEKLEQEAYEHNVPVDYIKFRSERINGLYVDGSIALRDGMTAAQTADTLAEELEHHYTTVGNILDLNSVANRKQERIARVRAYDAVLDYPELSRDTALTARTGMSLLNVLVYPKSSWKKLCSITKRSMAALYTWMDMLLLLYRYWVCMKNSKTFT